MRRGRGILPRLLAVIPVVLLAGCAARPVPAPGRAPFAFPDDAFAFANITVWEYDVDPVSGGITWRPREPPPDFSLRCGTMARLARQFWSNARFDPGAPAADAATYERLVDEIIDSDPRRPAATPTVIPGYPNLYAFSAAHRDLLVRAMAGPWQSYLQRGNWRMIFPFTPSHQRAEAERLLAELARGWPPVVHVLRYPFTTINHLVLVYDAVETAAEILFFAYDPNDAKKEIWLTFDRAARLFSYPATPYFPGGPVKAYEVYDSLLY
jgi:hypothetical protein